MPLQDLIAKLRKYTHSLSVLYVEDDPLIRKQTEEFLRRFFDHLSTAEDGAQGLELYAPAQFDIIITDINMPRMNGIELCRAIRLQDDEQPLVITSAYNESDYFIQLIDIGVDKFIMKPFDNLQFLKALHAITKSIYAKKREQQLTHTVERTDSELLGVLNLLPEPIAIYEGGERVRSNNAMDLLLGTLTQESPPPRLFERLCQKNGCAFGSNDAELLQAIKKQLHARVCLLVGKEERLFITHTADIEKSGRTLLQLTDVTEMESRIEQDEATGLANRNLLYKRADSLRGSAFTLIPFLIKNLPAIRKWHGPVAALEAERLAASLCYDFVHHLPDAERPGVYSLGRNRFALIVTTPAMQLHADRLLATLGEGHSEHPSSSESAYVSIPLQPASLALTVTDEPLPELLERAFTELLS